jgi:hypothetical protein
MPAAVTKPRTSIKIKEASPLRVISLLRHPCTAFNRTYIEQSEYGNKYSADGMVEQGVVTRRGS